MTLKSFRNALKRAPNPSFQCGKQASSDHSAAEPPETSQRAHGAMSARGRPRDLIRTALSAAALAARQGSVTALTAARFHSRATHERRQRRRREVAALGDAGGGAAGTAGCKLRQRRKLTLALTTLPRCNETTGTIEMTPPMSHADEPRACRAAACLGTKKDGDENSAALLRRRVGLARPGLFRPCPL